MCKYKLCSFSEFLNFLQNVTNKSYSKYINKNNNYIYIHYLVNALSFSFDKILLSSINFLFSLVNRSFSLCSFSCCGWQSPNNIRFSVVFPWIHLSCWGCAWWWGVLFNLYLRSLISSCNSAFSYIGRFCSCKNSSTIFWVSLSEFCNVCLALLYMASRMSVIMGRESHKTAKYQVFRTETEGVVRIIWCAYRL